MIFASSITSSLEANMRCSGKSVHVVEPLTRRKITYSRLLIKNAARKGIGFRSVSGASFVSVVSVRRVP